MVDLVLPGMVKRNKGIIVGVSSIYGYRPTHLTSSYSASKVPPWLRAGSCGSGLGL